MSEDCCSQLSAGSAVCETLSQSQQHEVPIRAICPQCKQKGKAVQTQTVKAFVVASLRLVQNTEYYFCHTEFCPVVYYSADGLSTFLTSQVREPVFQKVPDGEDVYVCYCFRHTVTELRNASPEIAEALIEDISIGIQNGQCACDLRNPQGSCCLGNVRRLIRLQRVGLTSD